MASPQINIIAVGSKEEKGRALEQAVGAVWSQLGYRKLIFNAHVTGEEIDVEGIHVVSGETLKGQCKAHAAATDTMPLRLFLGDVEKARGKTKRLAGIFVSQSGFTGTAQKWYDELIEEQRGYFKIQTGVEFILLLKEARRVLDGETLVGKLADFTNLEVSSLCLIFSERGEFWLVTFGDAVSTNAYFCLLTGLGEKPRQEVLEYLLQRLPGNFQVNKRISLGGRESVVTVLLRSETRTVTEIATEAMESQNDIAAAVASLQSEGLVQVIADKVSLRNEIDAFVAITKMSFASKHEVELMKSKFYATALDSVLVRFIEGKYFVSFTSEEAQALARILALSPSALWRVVAGNADRYRNSEEHIAQLKLAEGKATEYRDQTRQHLFDEFTQDLVADSAGHKSTPFFALHNITLIKTNVGIKIARRKEPFLLLESDWYTQMMKADGPLKAGQLVSASGPGVLLEGADATMNLGELDDAIAKYDSVIKEWPNTQEAYFAANNKGCCLLQKGSFDNAIDVFKPLLEKREIRKHALQNLARSYARKKDKPNADSMLELFKNEFGHSEDISAIASEVEKFLSPAPV